MSCLASGPSPRSCFQPSASSFDTIIAIAFLSV